MDEAEFYSRDERGYVSMLGLMRQEAAEKQDEFARGMEFACWMSWIDAPPRTVGRVMRRFGLSRGTAYRWLSRWRTSGIDAPDSGVARGIRFARWALPQTSIDREDVIQQWGITPAMAERWLDEFSRARDAARRFA